MKTFDLLNQVIMIMARDIATVDQGEAGIDSPTAKKLTDYAKTLVILNKDNREQAKVGEWEQLSNEETIEKLKEALKRLEGEDE